MSPNPNPASKSCILQTGASKRPKNKKFLIIKFKAFCILFLLLTLTSCHCHCQTSRLRCGFLPTSSQTWSRPQLTASPWEGTSVTWVWLQLLLVTDDSEFILCFVSSQGIHYILVHRWTVVTLFMGNDCSQLKRYKPSNQMLWLISFSCEALARGDRVRARGRTQRHNTANTIQKALIRCYMFFFYLLIRFFWCKLVRLDKSELPPPQM